MNIWAIPQAILGISGSSSHLLRSRGPEENTGAGRALTPCGVVCVLSSGEQRESYKDTGPHH